MGPTISPVLNSATGSPVLQSAISKAMRRLIPFLILMYVMAFLDRSNVGFAQQAFMADTGVSKAAYALGAGIFFVGYAIFEIPSNLILHRIGAKIWLARVMVSWGIIAAATMFVHTEAQFVIMRFLLGVAEAGFFPGVILYLTYWFPLNTRGKMTGMFYFGIPLSFVFGSPLSGILLDLNGAFGLKGWQIMFLVEGLLASLVGIWSFFYLDNKPSSAKWLTDEEKNALNSTIAAEEEEKCSHGPASALAALADFRVLYLMAIYFCLQIAVYGVVFYLPTQVAGLLGTKVGMKVGLVSAIPWICAVIATYYLPKWSDQTGERRLTCAALFFITAIGIAVSATTGPAVAVIALCFAAAAFISVSPIYWTMPTGYLGGTAAASGIALINALGNLGGFLAPNLNNYVATTFHSTAAGLYSLAGGAIVGGLLTLGVSALGIRSSRVVDEPVESIPV